MSSRYFGVTTIVSGGQTGADQGALCGAQELGLPTGGWVPKGRLCEDGVIPSRFEGLREADSPAPAVRTELNVRDSDATLILTRGQPTGGTALTKKLAQQMGKPFLVLDILELSMEAAKAELRAWLVSNRPHILNIAGPRASKDPEIEKDTRQILVDVLSRSGEEHAV
ncbi:MAG: hypothetical protein HKN21_05210 [Candidatus Eisenbacteria bacterium]|uniref:Molybdenum cofactor carrier n=1 Tax=Eiseniibacteriota bacterium TaxID=2212470 RepID=A0A7Y2H1K6_UNCEI|nr:hypothetical protein [Candidatus Eisenbacteria bacterium]